MQKLHENARKVAMEYYIVRLCESDAVWVTGARGVPRHATLKTLGFVLKDQGQRLGLVGWKQRVTAQRHVRHPREFVVGMIV